MFGAFTRADCLLTRPMLAVPFPCFVQLHEVVGFSSIQHDLLPFAVARHGERMGRTRATERLDGAFDQTPSIIATDLADESRVEARNRFRFLNAE